MTALKLSEVVAVDSGVGFPKVYQGKKNGDYPFLKVSDMNLPGNFREIFRWNNSISEDVRLKLRSKVFPAGALIFPKIGAAIYTNKKRQLTCASCVDNNVMVLVPDFERLDSNYLYFMFYVRNLSEFASSSNPPSIRKSDIERLEVRVPNVTEQRKVVDILTRAESILRLRREAEKKAAELVPELFIQMFGDPEKNPKNFPIKRINDISSVQTGATPSRADDGYYRGGTIPWVKTGEVVDGMILSAGEFITQRAVNESNCKIFPIGTVLVAMYGQGQTRGRSAVLGICAATNQACAAILPSESIRWEYLLAFFRIQYEKLRDLGRGGNQANLNLAMIKNFNVPLPPMSEQIVFAERVASVRALQSQQAAATAQAQASFDALLARAFAA